MNTYKLHAPSVEQQNTRAGRTLFIGLDVHNDSIALSLAPSDSTEVRRWGIIGGTHEHVHKFLKQLQAAHPQATLKFCYEAGPRRFPLVRFLRGLGHECIIVCPSRVPRRPGDREKTDRRDADQLARLLRAGELQGIHIPEPEDEALRDLLRSRDHLLKYKEAFDWKVFEKEERKMKRKKLTLLQNLAATLNLQLVPLQ